MTTVIIGIDCATDPKRIGIAAARRTQKGRCTVHSIGLGSDGPPLVERIAELCQSHDRALLAMDAPLGWPHDLGRVLHNHSAGQPIAVTANHLFRRATDRMIHERYGKLPLEVGADRIARTALAALDLLGQIGAQLDRRGQLAWSPALTPGLSAIEVYPAATLLAHWNYRQRYKRAEDRDARQALLGHLAQHLSLPQDCSRAIDNADILDAILCVLAGHDFLSGRALAPPPSQRDLARHEGWIWVAERAEP
ncbi:MAG: DUF429 domain-containing protein [Myxococcota bacterium]